MMAYSKSIAFITLSLAIGLTYSANVTAELFAVALNACTGRGEGFARDLYACEKYFYCDGRGNAHPGICDFGYVFDGETQMCVTQQNAYQVCFKCAPNKFYELKSVPHACQQFIQCFKGMPTLHLCSNGLAFDGRSGIHQCNNPPYQGGCHREGHNDFDQGNCPPIFDRPVFLADKQFANVYYVCYGQEKPERYSCPNGLGFDVNNGVCDYPRQFDVNDVIMYHPTIPSSVENIVPVQSENDVNAMIQN